MSLSVVLYYLHEILHKGNAKVFILHPTPNRTLFIYSIIYTKVGTKMTL